MQITKELKDFISKKFQEEIMPNNYTPEQIDTIYAALELMNITFSDYIDFIFEIPIDYEKIPNTYPTIKQIVESNYMKAYNSFINKPNKSENEENIFSDYAVLMLKFGIYIGEQIRIDIDDVSALECLEYHYRFLQRAELLALPEKLPDFFFGIKSAYEININHLKDCISKQFEIPKLKLSNTDVKYPFFHNLLLEIAQPLIEADLMVKSEYFISAFNDINIKPKTKIKWKGKQTELFYLLYRLFSDKHSYDGRIIPEIAFRLFSFPNLNRVTRQSTQVNYNKFSKRVESEYYIETRQKRVHSIFEKSSKNQETV